MPRPIKLVLILSAGWFFVVLGILGIFLPILQGLLFLAIGLILLSKESEWVQGKLDWAKQRYPKFGEKYDEAEAAADRLWRRIVGDSKKKEPEATRDGGDPI